MNTATQTPSRRVPQPDATLDQILDRQRELVLQREYQPLGVIDFIFVQRATSALKMDYRKSGPRLGVNLDTGDMLLLTPWQGLPELDADAQPCTACLATCGDCEGKKKRPCTLAGCGGSGYVSTRYVVCPECLGSPGKKTIPDCWKCGGRGEVPAPEKCAGCDEKGLAPCAACKGSGQVSTGRHEGKKDYYDDKLKQFVTVPRCQICNGQGRVVRTQPQDWKQYVHGQLEGKLCFGPVTRIVWHTLGDGARFQSCDITADSRGNLMVLMLENNQVGARQYLLGGVVQIR
ncbi:MAG: hypothetical protein LAP21_08425 [Acidobacteriia bacterium]|nr:hypothetical protein [Terriglobia bacterium]